MALPSFIKARKKALATRFISDLRVASDAFQMRTMELGSYPADGTPGQMPAGMGPYLAKMAWTEQTSIGGQWDWDNGQFGFKAGVSVYMPDFTDDEMRDYVDRVIDDGNLATGGFRKRAAGFISIIEF